MGAWQISLMEHDDVDEAVTVLSTAMLHNPLHVAVYRGCGESERLEIEKTFADLFGALPGIVFVAKEEEKIVGVMRMTSAVRDPGASKTDAPSDENDIEGRKAFWLGEWAVRRPKDQHWHLGPIGVLPFHRKQGIGSGLMQRFCDEVDHCSARAYLETDLDENVRFYKKFGFEIVERSTIFGVENRYMVRPAKAP